MGRERKPRTNDEALLRFADNVASKEVGPTYDINSMVLKGDEIYHYGYHYPMAKIIRRKPKTINGEKVNPYQTYDGPVLMVLINSTSWRGGCGFGWSTDSVVSSLKGYIKRIADPLGIPVYDVALTGNHGRLVYLSPNEADPEPEIPDLREIPVCPRTNVPTHPGPEPIDDGIGCVAGTVEEYSYQTRSTHYEWSRGELPTGAIIVARTERGDIDYKLWQNGRIIYGEGSWDTRPHTEHKPNDTYKQCPHCKAFAIKHRNWHALMHGGYNAHYQKVRMGWLTYEENILKFGDEKSWREARSALFKLRKQRLAEHAEWTARNSVSFDSIPEVPMGNVKVPVIDFATDTITPAIFKKIKRIERKREREYKQRLRERERQAKEAQLARERAAEEARVRLIELRERMAVGEMVDDTALVWLADRNVTVVDDHATMFKRVHKIDDKLISRSGTTPFEYKVGEWAIAEDYQPTRECGHGLHFAESIEATERNYGAVIIECRVPVKSIVQMGYKVKAERAYIVRVINEEN